jgi:hypothetical protein
MFRSGRERARRAGEGGLLLASTKARQLIIVRHPDAFRLGEAEIREQN